MDNRRYFTGPIHLDAKQKSQIRIMLYALFLAVLVMFFVAAMSQV